MTDRLIFFGTDVFSAPSLEALIAAGFNVVAVVTKPDAKVGRGRELTAPPVKQIAEKSGITVLQPTKPTEIENQLRELRPDAGIVVSYGRIIPQSILDLFPKGLINVHPSLLPKYRGPSPIEASILNGDAETGVTIMQLIAAMDAGPIYTQTTVPLSGHETKPELYEKLAGLGAKLLVDQLPAILDGSLLAKPQADHDASYVPLLKKDDGLIDWTKPAQQIEREVRAYLGWPGSRATIFGRDVTITAARIAGGAEDVKVRPLHEPGGDLTHPTGTTPLVIDRLKPAGKREMTGREFLAGLR